MKSIQELYNEVMADKGLKDALIGAAKAGRLEDFLKEHGCEATVEEVATYLQEKSSEDTPLSLDELQNAAGGECKRPGESDYSIHPNVYICIIDGTTSHIDLANVGASSKCDLS